ncbi:hypothetical protein, partial [Vannielia litorea]|uniref:hypothetical protein n=1 Tax=Vannielia litorea TaxID=1217970 RepID=UPI001FD547E3
AGLDLPQLPTLAALADWLMLPPERLEYLADIHDRHEEHGETPVNHYHYHLKPKKGGGLRVIEAPKQQLKAVQRQILSGLLNRVPPPRRRLRLRAIPQLPRGRQPPHRRRPRALFRPRQLLPLDPPPPHSRAVS